MTASELTAEPDPKPMVVVVAGTGTEVGKTWVTARVVRSLRHAGAAVAVRKPAQSHEPDDVETDASILAAASGEAVHDVCPPHRDYETAMAPPMAASLLDRPSFTTTDLVAELAWPAATDVVAIESAGGVRSPLTFDGDTIDLVRLVAPDLVVLVTDPGLGMINAARLCGSALAPVPPLVMVNRHDASNELHARNVAWLRDVDGFDVVTSPDQVAARILQRRSRNSHGPVDR